MDIKHLDWVDWITWMYELSKNKYAVHLGEPAAGTFNLNCSYLGIPCIGTDNFRTQKLCHPRTTVAVGDIGAAKSIAKAFKIKYGYHKEAFKILENYYGRKNFNDGRKKMAKMPAISKLIYNPSSAAPGFITKNVFSLPGVPSILNSMIENCKKYLIKGLKVHSKTINLFTVESNISLPITAASVITNIYLTELRGKLYFVSQKTYLRGSVTSSGTIT